VRLVAHRGRVGDDPENAIESLAGLPPWADGAEVDVQPARDGVLVTMHDDTVDRTTDGRGRVDELSADDLAQLELGDGVRVPRFRDYVEAFAATSLPWLLVDIKHDDERLVDEAVDQLHAARVRDRCVLLARTAQQLARARQLDPGLALGALGLRADNVGGWLAFLAGIDADTVFLAPGDDAYWEHRRIVPALQQAGQRFGGSIINGPEVLDQLVEDGGTTVITDRVAELQRWREQARSRRGQPEGADGRGKP
jgi:glycerophosphoryl diester phosphodiesterase